MPGYWLTINPSDLNNPIVVVLAGVSLSCDELTTEARRIRRVTAQMNPVVVAQFFHHIGEIDNHFGVVEINRRGMLHLHDLVWLTCNLAFRTLRDRLLEDEPFAARMIHYLQTAICQSINLGTDAETDADLPPSAKDPETDRDFHVRLTADSNAVASKKQLYSSNHTATCFKYAQSSAGISKEVSPDRNPALEDR
jgi:hypothetical protein